MDAPPTEPVKKVELPRVLGPWMGTAVVIGTVIGSGVFKKPQAVATDVPEFGLGMLAWVLVGLLALFGSLSLAEVAVLWPRAGGNYVFLREGLGRWAGFLWGWVDFWIIRSASIAALATIFTESLHDVLRESLTTGSTAVLPVWGERGVTIAVILALALVNARGTLLGGGLQVVVTTVKVLSLVGIAVLPFVVLALVGGDDGPSAARLEPVWPEDPLAVNWSLFGGAMVGVLWAYHGWMNIGPVAEEVRNPGRNIPLSLIAGTLTVMALYLSANLAYYLVVPRPEIVGARTTPVATVFGQRLLGPTGVMLASAAVMTSVFGSLNGNLLVGPRLLFAMGRDDLAPHALARLHPRYQTPALAVLTLAAWSVLLVVFLPVVLPGADPFDTLTNYAMFGAASFETLTVATVFLFRRRYPPDKVALPYRCPLYPWLPMVYVLVMTAVLLNMFVAKPRESQYAVGFIAVGALVYAVAFARRQGSD
jgi:amino acid transporter